MANDRHSRRRILSVLGLGGAGLAVGCGTDELRPVNIEQPECPEKIKYVDRIVEVPVEKIVEVCEGKPVPDYETPRDPVDTNDTIGRGYEVSIKDWLEACIDTPDQNAAGTSKRDWVGRIVKQDEQSDVIEDRLSYVGTRLQDILSIYMKLSQYTNLSLSLGGRSKYSTCQEPGSLDHYNYETELENISGDTVTFLVNNQRVTAQLGQYAVLQDGSAIRPYQIDNGSVRFGHADKELFDSIATGTLRVDESLRNDLQPGPDDQYSLLEQKARLGLVLEPRTDEEGFVTDRHQIAVELLQKAHQHGIVQHLESTLIALYNLEVNPWQPAYLTMNRLPENGAVEISLGRRPKEREAKYPEDSIDAPVSADQMSGRIYDQPTLLVGLATEDHVREYLTRTVLRPLFGSNEPTDEQLQFAARNGYVRVDRFPGGNVIALITGNNESDLGQAFDKFIRGDDNMEGLEGCSYQFRREVPAVVNE